MKNTLVFCIRCWLCAVIVFFSGSNLYASHILGGELIYEHVTGLTYRITLTLYGDCGATTGAFETLPISTPQICIYDGGTAVGSIYLGVPTILCGTEITLLCTGDTSTCSSLSGMVPGVKKFVYSGNYTLPHTSSNWRFIYTGNNGSTPATLSCGYSGISTPSGAGRGAVITNLTAPGSTVIQLIDTLNNLIYSNSSPIMAHSPLTFFCAGSPNTFFPGFTDIDGDSLYIDLVAPTNGTLGCGSVGSTIGYTALQYPGGPLNTGSNPLYVVDITAFSFDHSNGRIVFTPLNQRSVVLYNVREYRAGMLVGTSQREMTFHVRSCTLTTPCSGTPDAGTISVAANCIGTVDTLFLSGFSCGVSLQWQYSDNNMSWSNISGATNLFCPFATTISRYYRCAVTCSTSGYVAYTGSIFLPARSLMGMLSIISDSLCYGPDFYTGTCAVSSSLNVTTYYGDGMFDNIPLTSSYMCHSDNYHIYNWSGSYYIKQILYDGLSPIDSQSYFYEYLHCSILPLKLFFDLNNNCVKDSNEHFNLFPTVIEVDSNGVSIDTVSCLGGIYYRAYGTPGTVYSFKVVHSPLGESVSCPISGTIYDTIQPFTYSYPVKYFGFNCDGSGFDLSTQTSFRAGRHAAETNIVVANSSCAYTDATLTMFFSPKYTFTEAIPPATTVSGNVIIWDVPAVSSQDSLPRHLSAYFEVPGVPISLGDTVNSFYNVSPIVGDADTTNNVVIRCDTIKGSYDPNYIKVNPQGYIYSGTRLQYTVNFENTGNDTAHNVFVMDTLDDNLDVHSLRMVMATSTMNIAIQNIGGHNVVKFDFPHINLLDSSHHGLCDGMVIFNINTLIGLPDGTTIFNHAGIFFDDNPAVLTDTVEDIIGIPTLGSVLEKSSKVELYPNPATNELTIKMDKNAYSIYSITNTIGQVLMQDKLNAAQTKLNIKSLPAGLYYVTLRGDNGSNVQKFVKQ